MRIWSHLLKKSLIENFSFYAVEVDDIHVQGWPWLMCVQK